MRLGRTTEHENQRRQECRRGTLRACATSRDLRLRGVFKGVSTRQTRVSAPRRKWQCYFVIAPKAQLRDRFEVPLLGVAQNPAIPPIAQACSATAIRERSSASTKASRSDSP